MLHLLLQTLFVAGILTVLVMIVGPVFRLSPAVRYGLWLIVLIKLFAPPVVDRPWDPTAFVAEAVTLPALVPPAEAPVAPVRVGCESEGLTVRAPCGLGGASLLWIIWALGSLVVFVTLGCRILRFRRVLSQSYPAPEHIVDIADDVGRQLGIPAPAVRVVPASSGPCVWSLGRPVVVIPGAMLANEEVAFWQYVLSHELAHIRRLDHLFVWLEFAGFVLWWWNPLFWLVRHRLRSNAEMAADNWAVSLNPDNRRQYAEALLWIAERGSRVGPAMPALGASRRSRTQFAKRLTLILVGDHGVRVFMPGMLGLLLLVLGGVVEMVLGLPPGWSEAGVVFQEFVRGLTAYAVILLIFSIALGLEGRWRSFSEMSLPRFGVWEALAGATLGTLMFLVFGPDLSARYGAVVGALIRTAMMVGAMGLIGVGSAAGSLALAKARRLRATCSW